MKNKKNEFPIPSWNGMLNSGLPYKLLITIALLALYRLGVQIPISGIDHEAIMSTNNLSSNLIGLLDLFSGGALSAASIFALGIGPFITASIMMQLLNEVFPSLKSMQQEEGEAGRRKYQQWTRRLSILLALIQSFALTKAFLADYSQISPIYLFYLKTICCLVAGSVFVMWLGELISQHGVGNGGSLLIFAGIAARFPQMIKQTYVAWKTGSSPEVGVWLILIFFVFVIIGIIYVQEALRKLLIVSARKQKVSGVYGNVGQSQPQYLPLKINPASVLPIIFGSMTLAVPLQILNFLGAQNTSFSVFVKKFLLENNLLKDISLTLAQIKWVSVPVNFLLESVDRLLMYQTWEHSLVYLCLILMFSFFYGFIQYNPIEIAENLQKGGNTIQGVRSGKQTSEYLTSLLNRVILIGGLCIGIITILPTHVSLWCKVPTLAGLGSTSLIIMVGVALDMYNQVLTHSHAYEYKTRSILS